MKSITPESNEIQTLIQFLQQRINKRDIIRAQVQKKGKILCFNKLILHLFQ